MAYCMNDLLAAMNLAYNTSLKARARYELAQQGPGRILPAPCDAVRLWHSIANTWLLQSNTRFWVGIHSKNYPAGLLELKDPPLILFGDGNEELLRVRGVAMVGSRSATRTGLGTAPQPALFPRRNRIIAALADSLLVVEAALRSGSLITARVASELGRPVAAIPGSIHSSQSKGCHAMIKKGALLVETAQELLDEAQASLPEYKIASMLREDDNPCHEDLNCHDDTDTEMDESLERVLAGLGHEPLHVDALAGQLGLNAEDTLAALTELELLGQVLSESGGRWVRTNGVF
jgi:predicted Rossmann fold nucleotide-binding protein DprA/Smf involved in DNA uptake